VRIDLPTAFGRRIAMPVLLELAARYPGLLFNVSFTDRIVDVVGENIDLVVRIGSLEDSADLVARQIGLQHLVIVGAPDYLARQGVPHSVADLANHDCIVGRRQGHRVAWLLKQPDGSVVRCSVSVKHEIQDFEMVQAAVRSGQGLAQLPLWMVQDDIRDEKLLTVLDGMSCGEVPINLLWPHTKALPVKIRIIVDELIRSIPRLAP
jgi:DNA-binding transcriptional LysR family regulator